MIVACIGALIAFSGQSKLPSSVSLRGQYERAGLTVCSQNGPLCWDYTLIGLLEYEFASNNRGTVFRFSPGFLAWAATATDNESSAGSNFGRAYRGLERYGIPRLEDGGDPDSNGIGKTPSQTTMELAREMGRVDIHWIRFWNNRDALTDSQLTAIKTEISQGHPVAVGMRWPNRTRFVKGTYLLEVPRRRDIFDGHCVALIGYKDDPAIPGGGSFLFRNSWGAGWADGGYASMPYELLRFCVNDALSARIERSNLLLTTIPPGHEASAFRVSAVTGPPPKVEDMSSFGPTLAGKTQLHFSPSAVGQSFTVDVPIPARGEYSLRVSITRQEDFGKYLIDVREKSPKYRPAEIDGSGPGVSQSWPILIDRLRLKSGYCHVTFKAVGQNSASHGIGIGIDQIELVRQP